MGLCKDCFHREVCESWTTIKLDDIPPEIPCGHFKNAPTVTLTETTDFGAMIAKTNAEIERLAKELDEHMKTIWDPIPEPPKGD